MKPARMAGALAALVLSGAAQADLFDRGGGMIYDDDLNITWLADWNYAQSSGFDADGRMNWYTAMSWADSLEFGGYSDWRLPSALDADGSGPCQGAICTGGELGHMFYDELGASAGSSFLTGDPAKLALFKNVQTDWYWTNTDYQGYAVFFSNGGQGNFYKDTYKWILGSYAVAVRDGDVTAVPEPETAAMMLFALGAMMVAVRRRPV